jgi:hypothetical protein
MIAAGHDHSLPWPAGHGLEAQHARSSGVLDALGELRRVSLGTLDEGQLNIAPIVMVTQQLISMYAHHSEMPPQLKGVLKAKIASNAARALQTVPPAWTGVDDCIAQFFKALKEASRALPTTVAVFVRLALNNPDAVIPTLPLSDQPVPATVAELAGFLGFEETGLAAPAAQPDADVDSERAMTGSPPTEPAAKRQRTDEA